MANASQTGGCPDRCLGALPDDVGRLKALVHAERAENDRLRAIIKEFQHAQFGRRSEKIDPEQLRLVLEELEQADARKEAEEEKDDVILKASRGKDRHANRGALPKHLPRIDNIIEPTSTCCPCCGDAMHVIGESKSERLDVIPALDRAPTPDQPRDRHQAAEVWLSRLRERRCSGADTTLDD